MEASPTSTERRLLVVEDHLEAELHNEEYEDTLIDDPNNTAGGGSSVWGATMNFTNCIIGAGAIGLGGAIAESGGLVSLFTIVGCAVLVKLSLDVVIELSLAHGCSTFEQLGQTAFGMPGRFLVIAAKFAYSFGCLIAYTVVIQDNLGPALADAVHWAETNPTLVTWIASATIVLPLCLLRDLAPLAGASLLSVLSMLSIVVIVMHLWWVGVPEPPAAVVADEAEATTASLVYHHWFQIRWSGFLNNMGTFVFTFVCQHTAHLAFDSLRRELQNLPTWKVVSTASITISCLVSLTVGAFVYMTFWERTVSDIFQIYPATKLLDGAKLLLCFTMLLTFPMPFFTCRELIALSCRCGRVTNEDDDFAVDSEEVRQTPDANEEHRDPLGEPLLPQPDHDGENGDFAVEREETTTYTSLSDLLALQNSRSSLVESEEDFSVPPLSSYTHTLLTVTLWFVSTTLAVAAPNLGDVLDLVGCLSGTLIAFILPALISIRLSGASRTNSLILGIGGVVGAVGTVCSIQQLLRDSRQSSDEDG